MVHCSALLNERYRKLYEAEKVKWQADEDRAEKAKCQACEDLAEKAKCQACEDQAGDGEATGAGEAERRGGGAGTVEVSWRPTEDEVKNDRACIGKCSFCAAVDRAGAVVVH